MILHLLGESKFDSLIMRQIEECFPGENIFLLFSGNRSLNDSEQSYKERILFQQDLSSIEFSKIDGIIIHYLSIPKAKYLYGIPHNIPLACSVWGGDFYNFLPEFKQNLYGKLTEKYLNSYRRRPWLYYRLKDFVYFPISHNYKLWKKVVRNSKIYSTVIPYERKLIEKYFELNTEYLSLPTHSLDKVLDTDNYDMTICTKEDFHKNILIGNSGNITNNHLEILHFLTKRNDSGINVHLPLTYGDNQYISHICEIGYSVLGGKFHPLLNHLNYKDYLNYINSFNICIFNNYRQQGIGTINLTLWSGGKVYLSNKNVTKAFYKDIGFKIFSIEDDLYTSNSVDLFTPLTSDEILLNRQCLLRLYSREIVNDSIIKFIDKLKSKRFKN